MHVEFRVDQFSFYERTLNQNKDYFDRKVVNKIKPSINELLKILEVIKSDTLVILAIRKAQEIYRLSSHSDNIRHEVKKKMTQNLTVANLYLTQKHEDLFNTLGEDGNAKAYKVNFKKSFNELQAFIRLLYI